MGVVAVDGHALRDHIDWLWYTDGDEIELELEDGSTVLLERPLGESSLGIEFDDVVFDGVKTCCNACTFCFMTMLPAGMRPSLYVRDDDYRLSFLQGNFVTLTNMTTPDVERVIEQRLSPLNVSLHAITPKVRQRLMGRNHARGREVLEQLLDAGIEIRVQVVLVPGVNDGEELDATLSWIEPYKGISSVGIVPYGYTRYAALQSSYETAADAQKVINKIAIYQERSRAATGLTRFMASDEFYRLAYPDPASLIEQLPSADAYDGYPQYEDGIGMLRAFIEEWDGTLREYQQTTCHPERSAQRVVEEPLRETCDCEGVTQPTAHSRGCFDYGLRAALNMTTDLSDSSIVIATGEAFALLLRELLKGTYLEASVGVRAIKNNFFGGNVDVAGLITAHDLIDQLNDLSQHAPEGTRLVISDVMLNSNGLFLDDRTPTDVAQALNVQVDVVSCNARALIEHLQGLCSIEQL